MNSLDILKWKLENEENYKEIKIDLNNVKVFTSKEAQFNLSFLNKINKFKTLTQKEFLTFLPVIIEFFTSDSLRRKFNGYSLCDKTIVNDVINTYNTVHKTKLQFEICKPITILEKISHTEGYFIGYFILIKADSCDNVIPACLDKVLCWSTLFKNFIKANKLL